MRSGNNNVAYGHNGQGQAFQIVQGPTALNPNFNNNFVPFPNRSQQRSHPSSNDSQYDHQSVVSIDPAIIIANQGDQIIFKEEYDDATERRKTYILLGLLFLAVAALAGIGAMIVVKRMKRSTRNDINVNTTKVEAEGNSLGANLTISEQPSAFPVALSKFPTLAPTNTPTLSQTIKNTNEPTLFLLPNMKPSSFPTLIITLTQPPNVRPTEQPVFTPTFAPSPSPTSFPSKVPTYRPTQMPTPTQLFKYDIDVLCWKDGYDQSDGICPCVEGETNTADGWCSNVRFDNSYYPPPNSAVYEQCDFDRKAINIQACKSLDRPQICMMRSPRKDLFFDPFNTDPHYFLDYDCAYCITDNEVCNSCTPGARCLSFYERYWPTGTNCTESPSKCTRCLHPDVSYKCEVFG